MRRQYMGVELDKEYMINHTLKTKLLDESLESMIKRMSIMLFEELLEDLKMSTNDMVRNYPFSNYQI